MSISRRSFIKGMGIGCVGCTVGSLPPGALALNPVTSLKGQSKLTPSLCEMCSYRCPIEAQVVNNKTVFIQGNRNSPHQKLESVREEAVVLALFMIRNAL